MWTYNDLHGWFEVHAFKTSCFSHVLSILVGISLCLLNIRCNELIGMIRMISGQKQQIKRSKNELKCKAKCSELKHIQVKNEMEFVARCGFLWDEPRATPIQKLKFRNFNFQTKSEMDPVSCTSSRRIPPCHQTEDDQSQRRVQAGLGFQS